MLAPPGARRAPCWAACAAPTDGPGDLIAFNTASKDNAVRAALSGEREGNAVTAKLHVPGNISVVTLPPRSPELNPQENIRQFMRDDCLSNRVFPSYNDIVDHCCHAWNKLVEQPWRIMSIGLRQWATGHDQSVRVLVGRSRALANGDPFTPVLPAA